MKVTSKILLTIFALFMQMSSFGTSIIYPKFGTPIVTPDQIIFSEPAYDSQRIVCISRSTGDDLWDIKDSDASLNPCFILNNQLIYTEGTDIHACDLISGENNFLYRTGYDRCWLEKTSNQNVFVKAEIDDVDYLSLVDLEQKKELWKIPHITSILTHDNGIALCTYAERKYEDPGYTYVNSKLYAIVISTGEILWTLPVQSSAWGVEAISVSGTFIICDAGMMNCVEQQTGSTINSHRMGEESWSPISLAEYEDKVIVWTRVGDDVFSGHVIYSLSVPNLNEIDLFKPDWGSATTWVYGDIIIGRTLYRTEAYHLKSGDKLWQGGQWDWSGEHDGFLYFSRSDSDGKHTCLEKINIQTGERTEIYRALLPESAQWEAEPEGIEDQGYSYDLVPGLISSGEIENVEIYDSGVDFDAVFIKKDGSRIPIEKPLYLTEDAVFLQQLKANDIEYVLDDENEAEKTFKKRVDILHYQSVPVLLASKEVKKVEIYGRGRDDIEAVFIKIDGTRVPVSGCYGLYDDPVFHQYLRNNNIHYIVYDRELKISSPDEPPPWEKKPSKQSIRSLMKDSAEIILVVFLLILAASSPLWVAIALSLLFKKINRHFLSILITPIFAGILYFFCSQMLVVPWNGESTEASIIYWIMMLILSAGIPFLFIKCGIVIGDLVLKGKTTRT